MRINHLKPYKLLFLLTSISMPLATYAESVIRISCNDADAGSAIYINEQLKGECPKIDVFAQPGVINISVIKTVDNDHEQRFDKKFTLGDDVTQRIEVVLSNTQLTAAGKQRAIEAAAAAKAAEAKAAAAAQLQSAQTGNIAAMLALSQLYRTGEGVPQDAQQAEYWSNLAEVTTAKQKLASAQAGDITAMTDMASLYTAGKGVTRDPEQALYWQNKATAAQQQEREQEREANRQKQMKAAALAREQKINSINFMEFTGDVMQRRNGFSPAQMDDFSYTTTSPIALPYALLFDIISTPSKISTLMQIKNETAFQPSTWAKPDSMIAQAFQQNAKDQ